MRNVNDVVVKTVTTDSSGYVIKAVSTSTAGPGGCVVIHTEEEKRLVFFTEKSDHLVPELPPRIYHVPIFSRPSVITPGCTEASTNTEAQSSCKVCSQSKPTENTLPQPDPKSTPESSSSPPESSPPPSTDPKPQPTPSTSQSTAKTRKERKPRRRKKSKKRSSSRRKYCSYVTSSSDTESDFDSFSDTENSSSSCWCEKEDDSGIKAFSVKFGNFNSS